MIRRARIVVNTLRVILKIHTPRLLKSKIKIKDGLGDRSLNKVLAVQVQKPKSNFQAPCKKLSTLVHICNVISKVSKNNNKSKQKQKNQATTKVYPEYLFLFVFQLKNKMICGFLTHDNLNSNPSFQGFKTKAICWSLAFSQLTSKYISMIQSIAM